MKLESDIDYNKMFKLRMVEGLRQTFNKIYIDVSEATEGLCWQERTEKLIPEMEYLNKKYPNINDMIEAARAIISILV